MGKLSRSIQLFLNQIQALFKLFQVPYGYGKNGNGIFFVIVFIFTEKVIFTKKKKHPTIFLFLFLHLEIKTCGIMASIWHYSTSL